MTNTQLKIKQVDRFIKLIKRGETIEYIMEITDLSKKTIITAAKTLGLEVLSDEELRIKKLSIQVANKTRKKHISKPKPDRDQSMKRKCLTCGDMFDSWGYGNRICRKHNETAYGNWNFM